MTLLDEILDDRRRQVSQLRRAALPSPPERRALGLGRSNGEPLRIIAEIKRRSPSAGALSTALTVAERAAAYERGGAAMISVLSNDTYFDGSLDDLGQARAACALPLLCKEFVIDEVQVDAARAHGADAVLLIARIVSAPRLVELLAHARRLGLDALVEVCNHDEARQALHAGAELIGVNARNLDTLEMDLPRAGRVLASLPSWVTAVHLSGLSTGRDVAKVAASRAQAALIGEALMRCDDPEPLLRSLCQTAR
ncbi:MAG: indole-3-glycerol phosphate synthase TrpC [Polyangiaceae bacterium]